MISISLQYRIVNIQIGRCKRRINSKEVSLKSKLLPTDFAKANIPSLALRKRAFYGFVWYVHPYPRTRLSAYKVQLPTLVESRAECKARAGSTAAHQKER